MMTKPSTQQLAALAITKPGALMLFYQFTAPDIARCSAALAQAATAAGGTVGWTGDEQQLVCGRIPLYQRALSLHFPDREAATTFVTGSAHAAAVAPCTALLATVVAAQPKALARLIALFTWVLPHWPFDNTLDTTEEPGVDISSVMPTSRTIAELRSHPDQDSPLAMINWLKFRARANYKNGEAPASGREAYLRYGKVALLAAHSLGARLIHAARYRMILVGNGGDPGLGLWDEFALMQYPGRAAFGRMAQLRRYRRALNHREAGLAEWGQGLTLATPTRE